MSNDKKQSAVKLTRDVSTIPDRLKGVPTALVRCSVEKIQAVDHVKQNFDCQFFIEMVFEGAGENEELKGLKDMFFSQWDFLNAVSYNALDCQMKNDGGDLRFRYRVQGTFSAKFDLQAFPFDQQKMQVQFTSNIPILPGTEGSHKFEVNTKKRNIIQLDFCPVVDTWDVADEVVVEATHSDPMASSSGNIYPIFNCYVYIARKPGYFIWNVALPIFFLSILATTSWAVDVEDVADRLSISLTVLLAVVAYKFVIQSLLPELSYLTYLDIYVLMCLISLFVIIMENAWIGDSEKETGFIWGFSIAYGVFNVASMIIALVSIRKASTHDFS